MSLLSWIITIFTTACLYYNKQTQIKIRKKMIHLQKIKNELAKLQKEQHNEEEIITDNEETEIV